MCSGFGLNAVRFAVLIKSVRGRWTVKYAPHIREKLDRRTCDQLSFFGEVSKPAEHLNFGATTETHTRSHRRHKQNVRLRLNCKQKAGMPTAAAGAGPAMTLAERGHDLQIRV